MCREASSCPWRSPAATPSRSASDRFWLTFHLPSIRVISISMPTIPLSCAATKGAGASLTVLETDTVIDVMFSDVIMPNGMNGVELSRKAREMRPNLKILLASGYPMSALPSEGLGAGVSFISKPYRWTELADKLRALRS